jgi:predicted chitinase
MIDDKTFFALLGTTADKVRRPSEHSYHGRGAMTLFGVNTPVRLAMFLANVGHETGSLQWMEEIWGPTPQQRRYDTALANTLGNSQPGDGKRFRGRGPLMLTGRANYRDYTSYLAGNVVTFKDDLTVNPELVALPYVGWLTAGAYWQRQNLGKIADTGDFTLMCKRINGGTIGLDDRKARYARNLEILDLS